MKEIFIDGEQVFMPNQQSAVVSNPRKRPLHNPPPSIPSKISAVLTLKRINLFPLGIIYKSCLGIDENPLSIILKRPIVIVSSRPCRAPDDSYQKNAAFAEKLYDKLAAALSLYIKMKIVLECPCQICRPFSSGLRLMAQMGGLASNPYTIVLEYRSFDIATEF